MGVYKRGGIWWYKFVWNGEQIRASTKTSNKRVAEQIQSARKTSLAKGDAGIQDVRPSPSFREFTERFLRWVEREKKPSTIKFYNDMVRILLRYKPLAVAKLNRVDRDLIAKYSEHRRSARKTAVLRRKNKTEHSTLDRTVTATAVNHEVGTIRRILNLAVDWGVLESAPRVRLAGSSEMKERILSHVEEELYLKNAPQPLKDFATICLDTGLRPGELIRLCWRNVVSPKDGSASFLAVENGKTKNARRTIVLTDRVKAVLERRHAQADRPADGWVFPAADANEPFNYRSLDSQHDRLVAKLKLGGSIRLYDLRHTALTVWRSPMRTHSRFRRLPAIAIFALRPGMFTPLRNISRRRLTASRPTTPGRHRKTSRPKSVRRKGWAQKRSHRQHGKRNGSAK